MNLMVCLSRCENVPTNGCRGCELEGKSDCTFLVAKEARKRIKALTKELEQANGNRSNGTDLGLQFSEKTFIKKLYEELVQYQRDRRPVETSFMIRRFDNNEINTLVHVLGAVISEPRNDPLCDPHYHRVPGEGIVGRYISSRPPEDNPWDCAWEPIAAPRSAAESIVLTDEAFNEAVDAFRRGERYAFPAGTPERERERVMQTAVARDVADRMAREEEARRHNEREGQEGHDTQGLRINHVSIDTLEPSPADVNEFTQAIGTAAARSIDNLLRNIINDANRVHRRRAGVEANEARLYTSYSETLERIMDEGGETNEETDLQDV